MKKFVPVLLLALVFAFALAPSASAEKPGDTIYEIASGNGSFSTLVAAVEKAGLEGALDANRNFTVFAPTNDAFDAAAAALGFADGMTLVDTLDEATLTNILLYHVSPGERFSNSVLGAERIRTMNKSFVFVDGTTIVGIGSSANLLAPDLIDIDASNGVIHAIDFVLLPFVP